MIAGYSINHWDALGRSTTYGHPVKGCEKYFQDASSKIAFLHILPTFQPFSWFFANLTFFHLFCGFPTWCWHLSCSALTDRSQLVSAHPGAREQDRHRGHQTWLWKLPIHGGFHGKINYEYYIINKWWIIQCSDWHGMDVRLHNFDP